MIAASTHAHAAPAWFWWFLAVLASILAGLAVAVAVLEGAFDPVISACRRRRQAEASPAWLRAPYAGPNACYGCGLDPEVMNPGQWILCHWCNELRAILTKEDR